MKSIRIGKDIAMTWTITTNGDATSLVGRDLTLYLEDPKGGRQEMDFTVGGTNNNELSFTYFGTEHKYCGNYNLTLWENLGETGQTAVDKIKAFRLVANTDLERDDE